MQRVEQGVMDDIDEYRDLEWIYKSIKKIYKESQIEGKVGESNIMGMK